MIKYTAPEMEIVSVETTDVVLASSSTVCNHTYVNGVCTKCGVEGQLPEDEF